MFNFIGYTVYVYEENWLANLLHDPKYLNKSQTFVFKKYVFQLSHLREDNSFSTKYWTDSEIFNFYL